MEKKASELIQRTHPFKAYDKSLFDKNSLKKSYSSANYSAACAYYQSSKKPTHAFVPEFRKGDAKEIGQEIVIDLRQFAQMARNPVKSYFNRTLGIYLEDEGEGRVKTEENFLLNGEICSKA